jgi:anti-sigma regulatory factor (Ser/Thr protein kinase)
VDVPATRYGPRTARRIVSALLTGWGLEELGFAAELITSELVSNAYRHAPGTEKFELVVERYPGGVRLTLADGSSIQPVVQELRDDEPHGRGMRMIQASAARWGAEVHGAGKRVWVEIAEDSEQGRS